MLSNKLANNLWINYLQILLALPPTFDTEDGANESLVRTLEDHEDGELLLEMEDVEYLIEAAET